MKRLTIGLTATAIITLGVFAFVACEKEELGGQNNKQLPILCSDTIPEEQFYQELLNNIYSVATQQGDQFQLTFDKNLFLQNFEAILNNSSDIQYIAEDVYVYTGSNIDVPMLCVKHYDITNDRGCSFFIAMFQDDNNGIWQIGGFHNNMNETTVECTSDEHCSTERKGGCNPETGTNGQYKCSPCPNPFGKCKKTTTTTFKVAAVCLALGM